MAKTSDKKGKKSSSFEVWQRTRTVMEMLLKGYSRTDIVQYITNIYGVGNDMANKYISKAKAKLVEDASEELESLKAIHIQVRWKMFMEFNKDPKTKYLALEAIKDIAKIEGLYRPPEKDEGELSTGVATTLAEYVEKLELGKISKPAFEQLCITIKIPKERIDAILSAVQEAQSEIQGYDDTSLVKTHYT